MKDEQVRRVIAGLTLDNPKYVEAAKERAEKCDGIVDCPICADGTLLDTLHIFPADKVDLDYPMNGTTHHVKCPKCGHEGLFTLLPDDSEEAKPLIAEWEKQQKQQKRKNRKKRKR